MPEYALTRNYLELMVELPWNKSTTGELTKQYPVPSPSVTYQNLVQILLPDVHL